VQKLEKKQQYLRKKISKFCLEIMRKEGECFRKYVISFFYESQSPSRYNIEQS
jgi:hypothetical protein